MPNSVIIFFYFCEAFQVIFRIYDIDNYNIFYIVMCNAGVPSVLSTLKYYC